MSGNQQQFDFSVNIMQALLWEYNDATNLQQLLQQEQDWYDINQTEFWQSWFDNVFNLATANEFGLGVWAIILGIPLTIIQPASDSEPWGFGPFNKNFNNGSFANISGSVAGLTLEEQRIILQLRYFQLTSNGTVLAINAFLKTLFAAYGAVYVLDGLDMTCDYIFRFRPSRSLMLALKNLDLLPRPAGVKINIRIAVGGVWGFGPFWANFNNGSFGAY